MESKNGGSDQILTIRTLFYSRRFFLLLFIRDLYKEIKKKREKKKKTSIQVMNVPYFIPSMFVYGVPAF